MNTSYLEAHTGLGQQTGISRQGKRIYDLRKNMQNSGPLSDYYIPPSNGAPPQQPTYQPSVGMNSQGRRAPSNYAAPSQHFRRSPIPEPTKEQLYMQEIERLRRELHSKSKELNTLKYSASPQPPVNVEPPAGFEHPPAVPQYSMQNPTHMPQPEVPASVPIPAAAPTASAAVAPEPGSSGPEMNATKLPPPLQENAYLINKEMYDKQLIEEKKRQTHENLHSQLVARERLKQLHEFERETALSRRLDDLKRQREEEARQKLERVQRLQQYRADLDLQLHLRDQMVQEHDRIANPREQRATESPPPAQHGQSRAYSPPTHFQNNANTFFEDEFVPPPRYSVNTGNKMNYNPITGQLRDISQGYPVTHHIHKQQYKNQSRYTSEFAGFAAYGQPRFTKRSPKLISSFPVTGEKTITPVTISSGFKDNISNFFGVENNRSDPGMAGYGSLMLRSSIRR